MKYVFLSMIFLHIVDDFYLQGILAKLKQKKFWEENYPNEIYKRDYICSLVVHSLSWAFMIMIPVAFAKSFNVGVPFCVAFVMNVIIHSIVDDLKCNKFKLNLIQDQTIHIAQIAITFLLFMFCII